MTDGNRTVLTARDFEAFVRDLSSQLEVDTTFSHTLDAYLRALWGLAQHAKDLPVTFELLARLLREACTAESAPFDERWLSYTRPPSDFHGGFVALEQLILYQIADLHRMAATGSLNDPERYFGIDSPTGHRWYNFDVATFLECGISDVSDLESDSQDCGWDVIVWLLWGGQVYE